MEVLPGKTLENSGKQNLKWGSSPPEQRRKSGVQQFCRLFDRFRGKIDISVLMPQKLTIGRTSKNLHLSEKNQALDHRRWHDKHGAGGNPAFATLRSFSETKARGSGTRIVAESRRGDPKQQQSCRC
jgi:hypothetical protein